MIRLIKTFLINEDDVCGCHAVFVYLEHEVDDDEGADAVGHVISAVYQRARHSGDH